MNIPKIVFYISECDELGKPVFRPIKCRICGFTSLTERQHNSHKGRHHRGNTDTLHDEHLFKSGKYTYE